MLKDAAEAQTKRAATWTGGPEVARYESAGTRGKPTATVMRPNGAAVFAEAEAVVLLPLANTLCYSDGPPQQLECAYDIAWLC